MSKERKSWQNLDQGRTHFICILMSEHIIRHTPSIGQTDWEVDGHLWFIERYRDTTWLRPKPGPWFDTKMSSYQLKKSHYGDGLIYTVGFPIPVRGHLYIESALRVLLMHLMKEFEILYLCTKPVTYSEQCRMKIRGSIITKDLYVSINWDFIN